jgi:sialic acid synthase SpsE
MRTKFVAEVSSNHNGDLGRSIAMIEAAKEAGCDAVKFQLFRMNELFAPEVLAAKKELREREKWELPVRFLPKLADAAKKCQIEFSCTPFYIDAVEELRPFVAFYKVASYELLWHDLLVACAKTGKPLVLSTGMATMAEIAASVESIVGKGTRDLTLLHCTSSYPTPVGEANLKAIQTMRDGLKKFDASFDLKFGLSDHTVNPAVVLRSIYRYDAAFVEFHFDLEGKGYEFGAGHCWLPAQVKTLVQMARDGETAEGQGEKGPSPSELIECEWRADPSDGLRPLLKTRQPFRAKGK